MKINKLILLSVSLLIFSSCSNTSQDSKTLSREEAVKLLNEYSKHDFSTQKSATSALTVFNKYITKDAAVNNEFSFDKVGSAVYKKYTYIYKTTTVSDVSSWFYYKDNNYYEVQLDNLLEKGTYTIYKGDEALKRWETLANETLDSFYSSLPSNYETFSSLIKTCPSGSNEKYKVNGEGSIAFDIRSYFSITTKDFIPQNVDGYYNGETYCYSTSFVKPTIFLPDLTDESIWDEECLFINKEKAINLTSEYKVHKYEDTEKYSLTNYFYEYNTINNGGLSYLKRYFDANKFIIKEDSTDFISSSSAPVVNEVRWRFLKEDGNGDLAFYHATLDLLEGKGTYTEISGDADYTFNKWLEAYSLAIETLFGTFKEVYHNVYNALQSVKTPKYESYYANSKGTMEATVYESDFPYLTLSSYKYIPYSCSIYVENYSMDFNVDTSYQGVIDYPNLSDTTIWEKV